MILAFGDFAVKRDRHVVWNMAWSQKQNVQNIRRGADKPADSLAVSTRTGRLWYGDPPEFRGGVFSDPKRWLYDY